MKEIHRQNINLLEKHVRNGKELDNFDQLSEDKYFFINKINIDFQLKISYFIKFISNFLSLLWK